MRFINRENVKQEELKLQEITKEYKKFVKQTAQKKSLTLKQLYEARWELYCNKINHTPFSLSQTVIDNAKEAIKKIDEFYKDKKVQKHLALCYGLKCCYCESSIQSTTFFHVDHFYPQKPKVGLFPIQIQSRLSKFSAKVAFLFYHQVIVNDIHNYHVSCHRCNLFKGNFLKLAISPNYYYLNNGWKKSTHDFIKKSIWYEGANVIADPNYDPFIKKLKMNGENHGLGIPLYSSLLLARARHLNEVGLLLKVCLSLCLKKDYPNAKCLHNHLEQYFLSGAHFSTMIITNYGKAFLHITKYLKGK